jgi:hypothetical protein
MTDAFIIIAAGIIFLAIGMSTLSKKKKRLLREGEETEGEVSEIVEASGDDVTEYFPVIRFITAKNEIIEKVVPDLMISGVVEEGVKLRILYNPQQPDDFLVKSNRSIWMSRILSALGIIAVLAGTYLLLKEKNII